MDWLTEEEVRSRAKESEVAALECSIAHWEQIFTAGYDEFADAESKGLVSIGDAFCSLCQRYSDFGSGCYGCIAYTKSGCCNGLWDKVDGVIDMILYRELSEICKQEMKALFRAYAREVLEYLKGLGK